MIRKRLTKRLDQQHPPGYAPRLVLTVEGAADVYRLGRFFEMAGFTHGSWVGYHQLGLRILHSMDEQAPGVVAALTRSLGPARVTYRGRRKPRVPQLELGLAPEALAELEEAVR